MTTTNTTSPTTGTNTPATPQPNYPSAELRGRIMASRLMDAYRDWVAAGRPVRQ